MSVPASTSPTPSAAQVLWAAVTPFAVAWVWELVRYWGLDKEYADRYLIVAAAAWVAWHAWPDVAARPTYPSRIGVLPAWIGALVFPLGWYVYVQVGARPVLVWWAYGCLLAITVGVLAVTRGWGSVRRLGFALLFPVLALPIPGRFNAPLQRELQSGTTFVGAAGLNAVGIPTTREGFVLFVPEGPPLGIVEACSGVMLFTLLTALAIFLAYHYRLGLIRGAVLLALSVPVIVFANGIRVAAMGMAQVWGGVDVTVPWLHELIGSVELVLGFGMLYLLFAVVRPRTRTAAPEVLAPAPNPAEVPTARPVALFTLAGLLLGLGLTAAVSLAPPLSATTDGASIDPLPTSIESRFPDGSTVSWKSDGDIPIPDELAKKLTYHRGLKRRYRDTIGHDVIVFAFHWTAATTVKGYHHPDVCLPAQGNVITARTTESVRTPDGRSLPLTFREFTGEKGAMSVVYWTQEGRRFWSDRDETDAFAFTYPFQWVRERLKPRPPGSVDDRLVVWCYAPNWATSSSGKERFLGFVAALADEVYRACPWADPGTVATDAASKR